MKNIMFLIVLLLEFHIFYVDVRTTILEYFFFLGNQHVEALTIIWTNYLFFNKQIC